VYWGESGINTCLLREYACTPRGETGEDIKRGNRFERINAAGDLGDGAHCAVEWYRQTDNFDLFMELSGTSATIYSFSNISGLTPYSRLNTALLPFFTFSYLQFIISMVREQGCCLIFFLIVRIFRKRKYY
jgi:cellulose synthase/poly-beta-1,6-N-acetylglucosamine synthase-like glycosyltransferase